MKKFILLSALASILLASCTKTEFVERPGGIPVTVERFFHYTVQDDYRVNFAYYLVSDSVKVDGVLQDTLAPVRLRSISFGAKTDFFDNGPDYFFPTTLRVDRPFQFRIRNVYDSLRYDVSIFATVNQPLTPYDEGEGVIIGGPLAGGTLYVEQNPAPFSVEKIKPYYGSLEWTMTPVKQFAYLTAVKVTEIEIFE